MEEYVVNPVQDQVGAKLQRRKLAVVNMDRKNAELTARAQRLGREINSSNFMSASSTILLREKLVQSTLYCL